MPTLTSEQKLRKIHHSAELAQDQLSRLKIIAPQNHFVLALQETATEILNSVKKILLPLDKIEKKRATLWKALSKSQSHTPNSRRLLGELSTEAIKERIVLQGKIVNTQRVQLNNQIKALKLRVLKKELAVLEILKQDCQPAMVRIFFKRRIHANLHFFSNEKIPQADYDLAKKIREALPPQKEDDRTNRFLRLQSDDKDNPVYSGNRGVDAKHDPGHQYLRLCQYIAERNSQLEQHQDKVLAPQTRP